MANDRDSVEVLVKGYIGRSLGTNTTVIPQMINLAVRTMGINISNVYDEQRWQHTFVTDDVTSKINNWQLPSTTKYIKNASIIDNSGNDDIITPMYKVSQQDWYRIGTTELAAPSRNYNTNKPTYRDILSRGSRGGRVDTQGIPSNYTRIGDNIFVHPFPATAVVGWKLLVMLAIRPAKLDSGSDTNSLTVNYEEPLALLASAFIVGLHWRDQEGARPYFANASGLLTGIIKENELSKLKDSVLNLKP